MKTELKNMNSFANVERALEYEIARQTAFVEAAEEVLRSEMGAAYELTVPLDVSVGTGATWHEAGH